MPPRFAFAESSFPEEPETLGLLCDPRVQAERTTKGWFANHPLRLTGIAGVPLAWERNRALLTLALYTGCQEVV